MSETLYKIPILGIWVYNVPAATVPVSRFRFTTKTSVSLLYEGLNYTFTKDGIFWRGATILSHTDFFIDFERFIKIARNLDTLCDAIATRNK